jgi:hypothetical protein
MCEYNVAAGLSRTQDLKQRNQDLIDRVDILELFINALKDGKDSEAAAALARLRLGESVLNIVQSLNLLNSPIEPSGFFGDPSSGAALPNLAKAR